MQNVDGPLSDDHHDAETRVLSQFVWLVPGLSRFWVRQSHIAAAVNEFTWCGSSKAVCLCLAEARDPETGAAYLLNTAIRVTYVAACSIFGFSNFARILGCLHRTG
jgi:hypothetical protein